MSEPTADQAYRPSRAAELRALLAKGLTPQQIREHFAQSGRPVPSPEAIYRAKVYKVKGRPPPSRPSYYTLCKDFCDAYDRAYRAGKALAMTRSMLSIIELMQANLLQDMAREPITSRRRKRKGKRT